MYVYDPAADAWREGRKPPFSHYDSIATTISDKIYIYPGLENSATYNTKPSQISLFTYSPSRDNLNEISWEEKNLRSKKEIIGLFSLADNLFLLIKETKFDKDHIIPLFYNKNNNNWIYLETIEIFETQNLTTISFQNQIHILGGKTGLNKFSQMHNAFQAIYTIIVPLIPQ